MRPYDFAPLHRSFIGFDRWFELINNAQTFEQTESLFPPYDVTRIGEDSYRIAFAVAGFSPENVAIVQQQNMLTVAGQRPDEADKHYLHQGIAAQNFERRFSLADHMEVTGATFENGLLLIDLARRIPEAMKPRRIPINGTASAKRNK